LTKPLKIRDKKGEFKHEGKKIKTPMIFLTTLLW
jgi:hypothetical protein